MLRSSRKNWRLHDTVVSPPSPSKRKKTKHSTTKCKCTIIILILAATIFAINYLTSKNQNQISTWSQQVTGKDVYALSHQKIRQQFPSFNGLSRSVAKTSRVCIATFSLIGPTKNGGIATADTALAEALVDAGHEVTVLYLWGPIVQSKSIEHWVDFYHEKGINVVPLTRPSIPMTTATDSKYVKTAYNTYLWLVDHQEEFDVIHFHEWHGPGYYVSRAKNQGLEFKNTVIWTTIHCPALFYLSGSSLLLSSMNYFASDFLERKAVEYSDVVVSPSAFMLEWVQSNGWKLPETVYVQPNLLSKAVMEFEPRKQDSQKVTEFVFFGRIETLKGVFQFCSALDYLAANYQWDFDVTFMGNGNLGTGVNVDDILNSRAERGKWPRKPRVLTNKLQPEAITFLLEDPGRVAVIPSLHENSPYVVLECMTLGIPFLASDVGGTAELIEESFHDIVLFNPHDILDMVGAMVFFIESGPVVAIATFDAEKNQNLWKESHDVIVENALKNRKKLVHGTPLVTICMAHYNRGRLLHFTVGAIMMQTYQNFEIVIVDDGSNDPEALDTLKSIDETSPRVRLFRQENSYPGAARNNAVRHAKGEYVIFLDDDDIPKKNWLETMVTAALNTDADVVTAMCDFFKDMDSPDSNTKPMKRWVTLGDAADLGMFDNVFGTYSALVKRESFWEIGGFSEDYGSTFEDYEFLANAVLKGFKLEMVPEALLWYRQNAGSHLMRDTRRYDNRVRALRPYVEIMPESLRNAMLYSYGMAKKGAKKSKKAAK